jgi:hypothetical protein
MHRFMSPWHVKLGKLNWTAENVPYIILAVKLKMHHGFIFETCTMDLWLSLHASAKKVLGAMDFKGYVSSVWCTYSSAKRDGVCILTCKNLSKMENHHQ